MQLKITISIIIILLGTSGVLGYLFYTTHKNNISEIQTLNDIILNTESTLTQKEHDITFLHEAFQREQERNNDLEERVQEAEDVLGIIVKIQNTDKELLQKYSKVYFLNEHYQPEKLRKISDKYIDDSREQEQYIHSNTWPFLKDMIDEAEDDNVDLQIISAFRSFDEQTNLKSSYAVSYGSGANTFSADQGYSEHQLGTTIDLTTKELSGSYTSFATSYAYEWMLANAHKYGFTLSYPEGNAYYQYEPWHWRFVGKNLATYLHRKNLHFYDLDQREIDEYLVEMFD